MPLYNVLILVTNNVFVQVFWYLRSLKLGTVVYLFYLWHIVARVDPCSSWIDTGKLSFVVAEE